MTNKFPRATDGQIIWHFKHGWFINQIRKKMHVGIHRIRRVLDEEGLREGVSV